MTEAKLADPRIIAIDSDTGRAESNRWHVYMDCSFIKDRKPEEIETIGEREARLLGLKVCSVCERRKTGGPTLKVVTEALVFVSAEKREAEDSNGEYPNDKAAWDFVNYLKDEGFYIAQRGTRSASKDSK